MAKWEKNTRWSKINFLISVFFFFYWINMSVKDNKWPLKCFRGKKYPDTDPWMPICWKDKEKQIFLYKFFKVICYWFNICNQNMFLWDMLRQAMLFKGMRTNFKRIETYLSFYLSFLPLYFLNQTLSLQYQYFFWTHLDGMRLSSKDCPLYDDQGDIWFCLRPAASGTTFGWSK